jgi:O-antigen ligase
LFDRPLPPGLTLAFCLACTVPSLLAYNLPPSTTLFNQVAAMMAWGGLVALPLALAGERHVAPGQAWPALLALALLLGAALASVGWTQLPLSLALHAAALLAAAMVLLLTGVGARASGRAELLMTMLCLGWVLAGVLNAAIGITQVFFPWWADGDLIARSAVAGRAVSNMRQPNHLASLLMWSCVAAVWLGESKQLRRAVVLGLLGLFVFTVVLSASRTGMLGVFMLAAWGLFDRKLSRASRLTLLCTPLMLAASWLLMSWWAQQGAHAFGAANRLSEGAGSPSRLAILANAWSLVKQHPLTGVGWGEFNLAWTMTPFPDRPVAFFDHTHNLPMQLMVELGLPLSIAVMALLAWALLRALKATRSASGMQAVALRCAFMMVLTIGLHSLLEYPLWYAYFLLPTALFLGLCLGSEPSIEARKASASIGLSWPSQIVAVGGVLMVLSGIAALAGYREVVVIYAPPAAAAPLETRIALGQHSMLYSTHADYAAATTLSPGPAALAAAKRTAHNLIDVRLMMSWAQSLHATGDDDRARYVVQRLKEFRSSQAQEWLDECKDLPDGAARPFQCDPPSREYSYKEMR